MSQYDKEEMLKNGEWYLDDNNDYRWSASNTHHKRAGSWALRPSGAAPLMTQERSLAIHAIRSERRLIAFENAIIRAAEEFTGERIDNVEDAEGILVKSQALKGMRGNTAAAKLALTATGALGSQPAGITNIQTQNILQISNLPHYTPDYVEEIARDAPDYAESLLANADWAGKEELQAHLRRELHDNDTATDE